jgi:hypothetical protein
MGSGKMIRARNQRFVPPRNQRFLGEFDARLRPAPGFDRQSRLEGRQEPAAAPVDLGGAAG